MSTTRKLKWNKHRQLIEDGVIVGHIANHLGCRDWCGYIRYGERRYSLVASKMSLKDTKAKVLAKAKAIRAVIEGET